MGIKYLRKIIIYFYIVFSRDFESNARMCIEMSDLGVERVMAAMFRCRGEGMFVCGELAAVWY